MKNTKHQTPNTREAPNTKETPNSKRPIPPPVVNDLNGNWSACDNTLVLKDAEAGTSGQRHPFDLEERTAVFGERLVGFSKRIPRNPINDRLVDQLVGAGTSLGANYCGANDCVSQKDFRFTIKRCLKEAKETRFFLRMVAASEPDLKGDARDLYREATELVRIFASMYRK